MHVEEASDQIGIGEQVESEMRRRREAQHRLQPPDRVGPDIERAIAPVATSPHASPVRLAGLKTRSADGWLRRSCRGW